MLHVPRIRYMGKSDTLGILANDQSHRHLLTLSAISSVVYRSRLCYLPSTKRVLFILVSSSKLATKARDEEDC